jgi:hypothetical protein
MGTRPYDLVRVRIEGDDDHRKSKLTSEFDGAADDGLMPAVHAVEYADGDDRPPPIGGDVVQPMPTPHLFAPLNRPLVSSLPCVLVCRDADPVSSA